MVRYIHLVAVGSVLQELRPALVQLVEGLPGKVVRCAREGQQRHVVAVGLRQAAPDHALEPRPVLVVAEIVHRDMGEELRILHLQLFAHVLEAGELIRLRALRHALQHAAQQFPDVHVLGQLSGAVHRHPRQDGIALDHQVNKPVSLFRAYHAADVHHLRRELPGLSELLHHCLEAFVRHRPTPYRNP